MSVVWEAPTPNMIWAIHSPLEQLADRAVPEPLPPAGRTALENEPKVMTISFPHPTLIYTVHESMWPPRAFGLQTTPRATARKGMPSQSFEFHRPTGSVRNGGTPIL